MLKKLLFCTLYIGIVLAQELEVDGDLKVTGIVESITIDSLEQMLAQQQILIDSLMGSGGLSGKTTHVRHSKDGSITVSEEDAVKGYSFSITEEKEMKDITPK